MAFAEARRRAQRDPWPRNGREHDPKLDRFATAAETDTIEVMRRAVDRMHLSQIVIG
jgi:hypothetical protein